MVSLKIPRRVKVGGLWYSICFKRDIRDPDGKSFAGKAKHCDLIIEIDNTSAQQYQEDTFWHEVLHCLSSVYHIGLTEEDVAILTPALHAFLKDNKLLRE